MLEEIENHTNRKHWQVVPRDQIPDDEKVLDSVWSGKRKRRIKTGEVYKHKMCLTVHGGQSECGIHYWETFAPVVTWASIRLVLIISILQIGKRDKWTSY